MNPQGLCHGLRCRAPQAHWFHGEGGELIGLCGRHFNELAANSWPPRTSEERVTILAALSPRAHRLVPRVKLAGAAR